MHPDASLSVLLCVRKIPISGHAWALLPPPAGYVGEVLRVHEDRAQGGDGPDEGPGQDLPPERVFQGRREVRAKSSSELRVQYFDVDTL